MAKKPTKPTTRSRRKRNITLELPGLIMETIHEYIGPTVINKLNSEQSRNLMVMAADTASDVEAILKGEQYTETMDEFAARRMVEEKAKEGKGEGEKDKMPH